jgi:hypothetical protein
MEISVATRVLRGFHDTLWCLARKYRAVSKGSCPLAVPQCLGPFRPQPSRVSSSKKRWTWKVERSVAQFTRHGGETAGNEPAGVSTLGAGQLWHFSWPVVIRINKEHTHTTARLQRGSSTKLLPRDRFDWPVLTK